jgi:hypothetical protein
MRVIMATVSAGLGVATALLLGSATEKETVDYQDSESRSPEARKPKPLVAFSRRNAPLALEVRPGVPGYESSRLAAVMSVRDLFYQEPRDPNWALAVEERLVRGQRGDMMLLVGRDFGLQQECRTTICRLHWQLPEGASRDEVRRIRSAFIRLVDWLYQGVMTEPHPPNEIFVIYAGGISRIPNGDPKALFEELGKRRAGKLDKIRRGLIRESSSPPALTLMPPLQEMAVILKE